MKNTAKKSASKATKKLVKTVKPMKAKKEIKAIDLNTYFIVDECTMESIKHVLCVPKNPIENNVDHAVFSIVDNVIKAEKKDVFGFYTMKDGIDRLETLSLAYSNVKRLNKGIYSVSKLHASILYNPAFKADARRSKGLNCANYDRVFNNLTTESDLSDMINADGLKGRLFNVNVDKSQIELVK